MFLTNWILLFYFYNLYHKYILRDICFVFCFSFKKVFVSVLCFLLYDSNFWENSKNLINFNVTWHIFFKVLSKFLTMFSTNYYGLVMLDNGAVACSLRNGLQMPLPPIFGHFIQIGPFITLSSNNSDLSHSFLLSEVTEQL